MYKPFNAASMINGYNYTDRVTGTHMIVGLENVLCLNLHIQNNSASVYVTRDEAKRFFNLYDTIFGTAEADAWSRGFDYDQYLMVCRAHNAKPRSYKAYELFRQAFTQAMCDDQHPDEPALINALTMPYGAKPKEL